MVFMAVHSSRGRTLLLAYGFTVVLAIGVASLLI